MLRPTSELSRGTAERLDAAVALGADETWIDRAELGLPEPSPHGRWMCVLEAPGTRLPAIGCSGPDPEHGVESAAVQALGRFAGFGGPHRESDRPPSPPHTLFATRIPVARLDPAHHLDERARADRAG
jgi:hypothetical protein